MLTNIFITNLVLTLLFLMLIYLITRKNDNGNKSLLLKSFIYGIIASFIYAIIILVILKFISNPISVTDITSLLIQAVAEELIKGLSALYLINRIIALKNYKLLIICTGIGLGFSFIENIFYFNLFSDTNLNLHFLTIRIFLLPIMHVVTVIIFGYFIMSGKKKTFTLNFIVGLILASLIHFFWNFIT